MATNVHSYNIHYTINVQAIYANFLRGTQFHVI